MKQQILDNRPEYRLYYDDSNNPLSYVVGYFTDQEPGPEGNYIVIDEFQFLCKRYDVKIVNGKIASIESVVEKYMPGPGIKCAKEDISIIIEDDYPDYIEWDFKISEQ